MYSRPNDPDIRTLRVAIRKAVFPVAGLGTCFLPATKSMPTEMPTVVDMPAIPYIVDEAREAGVEHFIFVTGRNKAAIEDHFDLAWWLERPELVADFCKQISTLIDE